ncbi:MAG: hypothetical protein WAW36_07490 [Methylovulum miyakonense]|uniref:hypothetical protein n=1 Tax=Methylovulum miyakonense TaxID=645578 RepID=UPI003BB78F4A
MTNNDEKKALLETILGSEIVIPTSLTSSENQSNILQIVSDDLYNGLANYFGSEAPFFTTSLPLERIVRYKDGSFSSMEKSLKGGFSQHQGFDIVNGMNIVQQLMTCVMPMLNQRLTSIYSDLISQNSHYINQIQNNFVIPELSKLKSIAEFIKDVSDEIVHISKSNSLSIATLTNIQQRRIDLKQIFHTFLAHLEQSVNSQFFDPQTIANSYLIARHSLSNYIVSLVLESIVSGNLDDESIERMKYKIEKCFNELNRITSSLSLILESRKFTNANQINNINSFYKWSIDYITQNQLNTLHSQNQSIDSIQKNTLNYFDIDFEKKRLDEFVKSRHDFVKKIEIQKSN